MNLEKQIKEATDFLGVRFRESAPALRATPSVALVLGSGLSPLADRAETIVSVPYDEIPGFPPSTVQGHAGELVLAKLGGVPVIFQRGRVHYYEGGSLAEATLPIRVLARLGVKRFVITNASGGIRSDLEPGDLVVVSDHLNFMGTNPLIGYMPVNDEPRFVDMTTAYSKRLRAIALEEGKEMGLPLKEGIYAALSGPSYETPAEIRFLRTAGADLTGMSTVPEVIVASQVGLEVLVISCVSNKAAGTTGEAITHEEVIETTNRVSGPFSELLGRIAKRFDELT